MAFESEIKVLSENGINVKLLGGVMPSVANPTLTDTVYFGFYDAFGGFFAMVGGMRRSVAQLEADRDAINQCIGALKGVRGEKW